jgi:nucleoside phosphorylase
VLTALDVEYRAVRAHLIDLQVRKHPKGTVFEVGTMCGVATRIALVATGDGNLKAGVLADRAVTEFGPAAMLFVGIAGALMDDLALGDVVVATRTYAYHGGREDNYEFRARPRSWEAAHELEQLARHVERSGGWLRLLGDAVRDSRPAVHFRPVVAGEIVLNSRLSPSARQILQHYNDAAAIEMESAGAAQAAHLNLGLPMMTVRGISDSASGDKDITDQSGWRRIAAENAAAFALALICELDAVYQDRRTFQSLDTGTLALESKNRTHISAHVAGASHEPASSCTAGNRERFRVSHVPLLRRHKVLIGGIAITVVVLTMLTTGQLINIGPQIEQKDQKAQSSSAQRPIPRSSQSAPSHVGQDQPIITISPDHGSPSGVFTIRGTGWYSTASCGGQVNIYIDDRILSPHPGFPGADGTSSLTTIPTKQTLAVAFSAQVHTQSPPDATITSRPASHIL